MQKVFSAVRLLPLIYQICDCMQDIIRYFQFNVFFVSIYKQLSALPTLQFISSFEEIRSAYHFIDADLSLNANSISIYNKGFFWLAILRKELNLRIKVPRL